MSQAQNTQSVGRSNIAKVIFKSFVELIVPVVIAILVWYVLANVFRFWRLTGLLIALTFVTTLVLVSFGVSLAIRWFIGLRDSKRVLKTILSSIILPFIVSVAANTIPVSGNETVLTLLLRQIMGREEYLFIRNIGDTVISSTSIETKVAGISALNAIHTETTLIELFRIFKEDKQILLNYKTYYSLSNAIASYGLPARDRLVRQFYESTQATKGTPRGLSFDIYERYFVQSFESLSELIVKESADPKQGQERQLILDSAGVELRGKLAQLEMGPSRGFDPTLNFVLDTLLAMRLREDQEIYMLAKTIAADSTYAEATRTAAILLFASLGSRSDFDLLVSYLNSTSESVKAAALQGIEVLHRKLAESDKKK